MQFHHLSRRSRDHNAIGWISTTDTVMFGMVLFFVVAVFLEVRQLVRAKVQDRTASEIAQLEADRDEARRLLTLTEPERDKDRTELERLKLASAEAAERLKGVTDDRDSERTELEAIRGERDELRSSNESLRRRLANGSAKYRELVAKFETATKLTEQLAKSLTAQKLETEAAQQQVAEFADQIRALQALYDDVQTQLTRLQSDEKQVRKELIGLKGELRRVAIIFDASASMKEGGRWENARSVMATWLELLDVDEGALVVFSTDVSICPADGTMLKLRGPDSDKNRGEFAKFLEQIQPNGGTNTFAALEKAYAYPELDGILLFTDGAPNNGRIAAFDPKEATRIYALCQQHPTVPINAVGLGDYFKPELSRFLLRIAELTRGTFVGR